MCSAFITNSIDKTDILLATSAFIVEIEWMVLCQIQTWKPARGPSHRRWTASSASWAILWRKKQPLFCILSQLEDCSVDWSSASKWSKIVAHFPKKTAFPVFGYSYRKSQCVHLALLNKTCLCISLCYCRASLVPTRRTWLIRYIWPGYSTRAFLFHLQIIVHTVIHQSMAFRKLLLKDISAAHKKSTFKKHTKKCLAK